ncbi:MAG: tyrosine-type recombinase/integrase [Porticoccus sp.]|nr:tyrosine-type recombinase/integrase [Porticoccus sp.]
MDSTAWPEGIRPSGNGIRIKIWRKGKLFYSETVNGDPYKKADLASAIKRREWLTSRLRLGLPLHSEDSSSLKEFDLMAQDYLNSLDAKHSTQISYENILNRYWMPVYSGWPVDEITAPHIKKALAGFNVSQKTKKNILIPLRGVLDHAEVQPNPASGIRFKRQQKDDIERYTLDERDTLLKLLTGQSRVYFAILFGCGLRPCGEPLALKWTDYDGEYLSVSKQITKRRLENSTKTSVKRSVYVPTWVREILNQHSTRFAGEWIFVNSFGRCHLDTDVFNAAWKKAHKKARIPYRIPYACRHTRASELLSTGVLPADAANQMGHSLEMFLRVYARWIEGYAKDKDSSRFEGVHRQNTDNPAEASS